VTTLRSNFQVPVTTGADNIIEENFNVFFLHHVGRRAVSKWVIVFSRPEVIVGD